VESIATYALVIQLAGQSEAGRCLWQCAVKGCVEAGELGNSRIGLLGRMDKFERQRNVQRGKVDRGAQLAQQLRRNKLMRRELWPTMHHAMPNRDRRCAIGLQQPRKRRAQCLRLRCCVELFGANQRTIGIAHR